jgi:hypothetical protein
MVFNTPKMYLEFWVMRLSAKKMVLEILKVIYSNVLCVKLGATC